MRSNRLSAFADLCRLFVTICMISVNFGEYAVGGETDQARPYARVCISILDDRNGVEVAFGPQQTPAPGKSVVAHAVSSAPCFLLVVALNQGDGQLAYDWRPHFRKMSEAWEEAAFPESAGLWHWEKRAEPFDFYVLVLPTDAALVQEIERLVDAMQGTGEATGVLKLQTDKLHDLITQAAGDSDPTKHQATATLTEIRGVTRGSKEFLWRNFASTVYFDDRNSGLVVFRGGS
jgi:hypothetical protein